MSVYSKYPSFCPAPCPYIDLDVVRFYGDGNTVVETHYSCKLEETCRQAYEFGKEDGKRGNNQ